MLLFASCGLRVCDWLSDSSVTNLLVLNLVRFCVTITDSRKGKLETYFFLQCSLFSTKPGARIFQAETLRLRVKPGEFATINVNHFITAYLLFLLYCPQYVDGWVITSFGDGRMRDFL